MEKYIFRKDGSKRLAINTKCSYCGNGFYKEKSQIKPNRNNYCTKDCRYNHQKRRVKLKCSTCGIEFERQKAKIKKSKSGYYFCSNICKFKAQEIDNGEKPWHPKHYNVGKYAYRKIAKRNYNHICENCGYDSYKKILKVHHIYHNRENNKVENLMILCPNCHNLIHHKIFKIINRKFHIIKGE